MVSGIYYMALKLLTRTGQDVADVDGIRDLSRLYRWSSLGQA